MKGGSAKLEGAALVDVPCARPPPPPPQEPLHWTRSTAHDFKEEWEGLTM